MGFLILFFWTQGSLAQELDVPLRVDLGVEVCQSTQPVCSKTPFSGENIILKLRLVSKSPERWQAKWVSHITHGSEQFSGSVQLIVNATPTGFIYELTLNVGQASTKLWLNHLGELPHLEIKSPGQSVSGRTLSPYLYVSQPL